MEDDPAKLVLERRARSTKTVVQLWKDFDDAKWVTLCADHGGLVEHETRKDAEGWLSHPEEWCPTCQGESEELEAERPSIELQRRHLPD